MSEGPILIHRVIARLNVGGPAMHVVNLTRSMNDGDWRTRLVAGSVPEAEGDMSYYAEERGVVVTALPEMSRSVRPGADLRSLWALWRLFRRERPRVVHTHTAKAGTLGRIAAVLAGVPVRVHTFHGHVLGGDYFSAGKTRFFVAVERLLARFTQRLVVLTERQAREMADELAVAPRARFAVVPLGLELERFRAVDRSVEGARMRRELGLGEHEVAVGIVGRLVPIKNHELFLEGLAEARRASPPGRGVRGVVVGAGEREAELKSYATELGLGDDALLWLGWRRDLPRLCAGLDRIALTSHDEGTPVALLEALAAGTPVLARDVGGVAEVLERAGAGRTLPREAGAAAWGEAMAAPADPLPEAVRDAVAQCYSVARLTRDLDALYRQELGRR